MEKKKIYIERKEVKIKGIKYEKLLERKMPSKAKC